MKSNHLDPENLRIAQTDLCYNSSMRCPDCGGRKLRRRRNQRRRNPRRIIGPWGRGHWLRNPLKPKDYETRLNKLRKLGLSEEHLSQLSDFNTEYNDATQANYIIDWWLATVALQNDNKKYLSKYTNKYRITELEKELRMENYDALLHFARMAHSHSKFWVKWPSIPPSQLIESLKEREFYREFTIESRRKLPSAEGENVRWKMERKEEIFAEDEYHAIDKAKEMGFDMSPRAIEDGRTSIKEKRAKFYKPEHHNVLLRFDDGHEWVLMHPDDRQKEALSLATCATPESGGVLVSLRKRKGDSGFYQSLTQFTILFPEAAWKAARLKQTAEPSVSGFPGGGLWIQEGNVESNLFSLGVDDPRFRGSGVIGEGRGTSNHKPLEKYHPYIVALLEQDWVNFVTLPGYIPDKSFSIEDLSPSDKALLLDKKPWFGDALIWLKKFGPVNEKMTEYIFEDIKKSQMTFKEKAKVYLLFLDRKGNPQAYRQAIDALISDPEMVPFLKMAYQDINPEDVIDRRLVLKTREALQLARRADELDDLAKQIDFDLDTHYQSSEHDRFNWTPDDRRKSKMASDLADQAKSLRESIIRTISGKNRFGQYGHPGMNGLLYFFALDAQLISPESPVQRAMPDPEATDEELMRFSEPLEPLEPLELSPIAREILNAISWGYYRGYGAARTYRGPEGIPIKSYRQEWHTSPSWIAAGFAIIRLILSQINTLAPSNRNKARVACINTLSGNESSQELISLLLSIINDIGQEQGPDAHEAREEALEALFRIRHPSILPIVQKALNREFPIPERWKGRTDVDDHPLIHVLGDTKHPDAIPLIASFIRPDQAISWPSIFYALGNIKHPNGIALIKRAFSEDLLHETYYKSFAFEALEEIAKESPDHPAIADVFSITKIVVQDTGFNLPKNASLRVKVAGTLGSTKHPDAVEYLRIFATDPKVAVRRKTAQALGKIRHAAAISVLAIMAQDSDANTRLRTVRSLDLIKHPDVIPVLELLAEDADPKVSSRAGKALKRGRALARFYRRNPPTCISIGGWIR